MTNDEVKDKGKETKKRTLKEQHDEISLYFWQYSGFFLDNRQIFG